jgi:hypothetical protein
LPPYASLRVNTVRDAVEKFRWRAIDREEKPKEKHFMSVLVSIRGV